MSGGAERLVVDAAVGLKECGHQVIMYTSHHDKDHCFEETRDGKVATSGMDLEQHLLLDFGLTLSLSGTLEVRVEGNSIIPRTIFGRLYILCAILRQFHLCISLLRQQKDTCDVLFVDQLSACIPLLKLFSTSKVSILSIGVYHSCASIDMTNLMYCNLSDIFLLPLSRQEISSPWYHDATNLPCPCRSLWGIHHRFVLTVSNSHCYYFFFASIKS
jgi:hypothetical protein